MAATCLALAATMLTVSAGTGLAVATEPEAQQPGSYPALPPSAVPKLVWTDCQDGFQCATAQVPRDYRHPTGKSIGLPVIRKLAADPAQRIGALLMQPGGPGVSGVTNLRIHHARLTPALQQRFDVFGFDVRGVGAVQPLTCFDDARYTEAVTAARGRPAPDAFAGAVREAAEFGAECARNSTELLPFIGTDFVARDIDLLRRTLGEEKLTLYGRSFGTYIGTVYANLFPGRVRAMALDGAYDPVRYANKPYEYDRPQYLALDAAFARFLDWCGRTPTLCAFADANPRARFEKLIRSLDGQPVPVPGRGTANGYTLAFRILFNINDGQSIWPTLGQALVQAEQRNPASLLLSPPSPGSFDFLTPNVAVECMDRLYPRSMGMLERQVKANAKRAPLLGPPLAFGPPNYDHQHAPTCVQWPVERVSRYTGSFRAKGAPPILVVGTTGDPDTPFQDAVSLAETLEKGRLLTFKAEGHTAFERSTCAAAAITSYLADLVLPAENTVCADEVPPAPPPPPKPLVTAAEQSQLDASGTG